MLWLKNRMKTISWMLIASMLNLCLISTNVYSSQSVATVTTHNDTELEINRQKLKEIVNRQDVQKQLLLYGLTKEEVQNRIDALTDEEVEMVVSRVEKIPAGGMVRGVVALVMLLYAIIKILWCAVSLPFMDESYGECVGGFDSSEKEKPMEDESFPQSPIFNVHHILVGSELEAIRIIDRIHSVSSFQELAKKYSTDPSALNGGDLGWVNANELDPQFSKALIQMQNGEVSRVPVKTKFGWHIILREDSKQ